MAIALRLLELPVRNYELNALADSDGTSTMQQLRDYAASKGLFARAYFLTPDNLNRLDAVAILPVGLDNEREGVGHFLVFAGRNAEGQPVILDPLFATSVAGYRPHDTALESWRGEALVLSSGAPPFWLDPLWWALRTTRAALFWVILPATILFAPTWIARKSSRSASRALLSSEQPLPVSS